MFKDRILQALKTKYANLGFGDKAFDGVADYLSKTVTEESQIETAIGGVENLLKAFQGDIDKVRNDNSALKKENDELKAKDKGGSSATETNPPTTEKKDDEEAPAWAQAMMKEFAAMKSEKVSTSRTSRFNETIKDLSEKQKEAFGLTFNPDSFKSDEEFEAQLQKIAEMVPALIQEEADKGLGGTTKPGGGGDTKTKAEDFAKKMAEINKTEEK